MTRALYTESDVFHPHFGAKAMGLRRTDDFQFVIAAVQNHSELSHRLYSTDSDIVERLYGSIEDDGLRKLTDYCYAPEAEQPDDSTFDDYTWDAQPFGSFSS